MMPSDSSTTSSRLLRTAAPWTLLAVVLVELAAGRVLPLERFATPVEGILAMLDARRFNARTLLVGDSVAAQLGKVLGGKQLRRGTPVLTGGRAWDLPWPLAPGRAPLLPHRECDGGLLDLATTGELETTGQYYLVQRYLDRHPAPRQVVLVSLSPTTGDLEQVFTENTVQRAFLSGREMAELAWHKRSLSFGLTMLKYRLLPSHRHRQSVRSLLPELDQRIARPPRRAGRRARLTRDEQEWTRRLGRWLDSEEPEAIAAIYLRRMARDLGQKGIRLIYMRGPTSRTVVQRLRASDSEDAITEALRGLSREVPTFSHHMGLVYPDALFSDGVHVREDRMGRVARDYQDLLLNLIRDARP